MGFPKLILKQTFRSVYESESEIEVTQLCPTLCDRKDYSLPGFSIHGIFQARVSEWVAISLSRGSFRPRDRTRVSRIADRLFTQFIDFNKNCLGRSLNQCYKPQIESGIKHYF